jgi:hypothetical protein
MGLNVLPQYRLAKSFWSGDAPVSLFDMKMEKLERLKSLKPILARNKTDHLIAFDNESDPPILQWKTELLEQLNIDQLSTIINLLENEQELQTRKY